MSRANDLSLAYQLVTIAYGLYPPLYVCLWSQMPPFFVSFLLPVIGLAANSSHMFYTWNSQMLYVLWGPYGHYVISTVPDNTDIKTEECEYSKETVDGCFVHEDGEI